MLRCDSRACTNMYTSGCCAGQAVCSSANCNARPNHGPDNENRPSNHTSTVAHVYVLCGFCSCTSCWCCQLRQAVSTAGTRAWRKMWDPYMLSISGVALREV